MTRTTRMLGTAALALTLTACGALFNGGPAQLTVNSAPTGADIYVDGRRMGQTPMILELSKSENHSVELRRDGYQPLTFAIHRKVSTTYMILDVLGGLIPVVIDAATGSWYTLAETNIEGTLEREAGQASGALTPDQLESVKRGTPASTFIRLP